MTDSGLTMPFRVRDGSGILYCLLKISNLKTNRCGSKDIAYSPAAAYQSLNFSRDFLADATPKFQKTIF